MNYCFWRDRSILDTKNARRWNKKPLLHNLCELVHKQTFLILHERTVLQKACWVYISHMLSLCILNQANHPPGLQTNRYLNFLSYERIWQDCYKQCYSNQNKHAHLSESTSHANKQSIYGKERVLPWNEFIHDSIEAVVQITAGQMKVHQRFEQVYPAKARTVFNIAWFTIKCNNRLNIQN